ncbi:MAG TPA: hypothetical protein VKA49_12745 [Flavitalea sp.]|nr:hypothetical protein [Flavitalea sp.]
MKLELSPDTTVKKINIEFQKQFPFLKIQVVQHQHKQGESSLLDTAIVNHTALKQIPDYRPGTINFAPSDSVGEVEQRFWKSCRLAVQIFRKSGTVWLETAQTDNLSLEKQNAMGDDRMQELRYNSFSLFW